MMHRLRMSKEGEELPLQLLFLGKEHEQEPINRPSGMPFWQWFYTAEGEGELTVAGEKYFLPEKQVFLIAPGQPHSYRAKSEKWVTHFIGFGGNISKELLKGLGMAESGIYQMTDPRLFLEYLDRMLEIYHGKSSVWEKNCSHSVLCYEFLCRISRNIHKIGRPEAATENAYIISTICYLEAHFQENFSLDELADSVGVSKSYLCHLFHQEMGESIISHLKKIRLGRAGFLLRHHTGMRIGEVAAACGYETPSYFSKQFRMHYGMTPEEYRIGKREE